MNFKFLVHRKPIAMDIPKQWKTKMKLSAFFTLACVVKLSAAGYAQSITIDANKTSLIQVLRTIQKQSGVPFLLNGKELAEIKIEGHVKNMPLEKAMSVLLKDKPISWSFKDNMLVVTTVKANASAIISPTNYAFMLQTRTVKGNVHDSQGQPLSGATITLKGTSKATTTDASGNFQLDVNDRNAILVVKMIGFQQKEIPLNTQIYLDVTLNQQIDTLEEVVIVGYGATKKKELIGSVSQIDGKQLAKRTVPQLAQALTGQMPGVTVIQRSGQPSAANNSIQIRGVGSFGATTDAFILVDGIPTSSFNDIDPNDVASISVLKDASSAAIYGARAANGVILVTTKTGSTAGKLAVNYSGYFGIQKPTAFPEFVNSWEYASLINETTTGGGGYTEEQIQKYKDGTDLDNYPNSDYIGSTFKSQAAQTGHNLNISNTTEKIQYTLSAGFLNQKGIVIKNNFNKYNVRLNLISKLSDKLKLTTRVSAIQTDTDEPAAPATLDFWRMTDIISQVIRYPATFPIRMSNGDWGAGNNLKGTPVSFLESESFYKEKVSNISGNARFDWNPISDLTLSAIGGYTQTNGRSKLFRAAQRINSSITLAPSILEQGAPYTTYKTFQALADYTKSFKDHSVKILAGYSFEKGYSEGLSASRQNFPSNELTELNIGSPDGQTNSGSATEWALESLFGRVQYNYAKKYLLEGVIRYDGSSRFPTSKRYAIFPSLAAGWLISEELFVKDKFDWITELKLKGSYGILGNQNIVENLTSRVVSNYPYQNILNTGYNYPFGNSISPGVARVKIVDPNLRWESTRTADAGLEIALFKNLLTFSSTYYNRFTYDILVSPNSSVSKVLGFEVGIQNSGKLRNTGWEFTLGHQNKINEFSYNVNLNFSTVKNKVVDLGIGNINQSNGMVGNGSDLFIGYPIQAYYGYQAAGLFVDAADVASWADQKSINPQSQPGDIRYKDISGPDGVPDGKVDATYDRTVIGSRIPKYTYGINLGFNYKGFDLGLLLQGVSGVQGLLNNYAGFALNQNGNIQRWQADSRWTTANPDRNAVYPRFEQLPNTGSPNTQLSDYWLLNASYIRLKNVQLGYAIPKNLLSKWKLSGLRIYANAENIFTSSNYRKGWDPEINSSGAYYPIMRNFTFGVNLSF